MDNEEKWINRIMAVFFLVAMLVVTGFMIGKNQNTEKENMTDPTPTLEVTAEPQD